MEDRRIVIEKRIEFIIGILLLIPSIFGFFRMFIIACVPFGLYYPYKWTGTLSYLAYGVDGSDLIIRMLQGFPVHIAIMAFVGAYLIKGKLRYFIPNKKRTPKGNNCEE